MYEVSSSPSLTISRDLHPFRRRSVFEGIAIVFSKVYRVCGPRSSLLVTRGTKKSHFCSSLYEAIFCYILIATSLRPRICASQKADGMDDQCAAYTSAECCYYSGRTLKIQVDLENCRRQSVMARNIEPLLIVCEARLEKPMRMKVNHIMKLEQCSSRRWIL